MCVSVSEMNEGCILSVSFFFLSSKIKKEKKEEKRRKKRAFCMKKSSVEKEAKNQVLHKGAFVCAYERIDEFKLSSFF